MLFALVYRTGRRVVCDYQICLLHIKIACIKWAHFNVILIGECRLTFALQPIQDRKISFPHPPCSQAAPGVARARIASTSPSRAAACKPARPLASSRPVHSARTAHSSSAAPRRSATISFFPNKSTKPWFRPYQNTFIAICYINLGYYLHIFLRKWNELRNVIYPYFDRSIPQSKTYAQVWSHWIADPIFIVLLIRSCRIPGYDSSARSAIWSDSRYTSAFIPNTCWCCRVEAVFYRSGSIDVAFAVWVDETGNRPLLCSSSRPIETQL